MTDNIGDWFWEKNADVYFWIICFQDILGLSKTELIGWLMSGFFFFTLKGTFLRNTNLKVITYEWIIHCGYLCRGTCMWCLPHRHRLSSNKHRWPLRNEIPGCQLYTDAHVYNWLRILWDSLGIPCALLVSHEISQDHL